MEKNVNDALVEIVNERWQKSEALVLYAQVPILLSEKGFNHREEFEGKSLKDYIAGASLSQLRSIQSSEDKKIWALVPAKVSLDEDQIFKLYQKASRGKKKVRFENFVWQAFTRELVKDSVRYLSKTVFRDLPENGSPPEGFTPIERNFIESDPSTRTYDSVCAKIKEWCDEYQVDIEVLMHVPANSSLSAFWAKIADLPTEDLARIQFPADIVQKLVSKI